MDSSDLQRDEMLVLMDCMGVKLQKNTKIPQEDLNKRLAQTIDAAQRHAELIAPISPVNPSTLSKWKPGKDKTLVEAVTRVNIAEAYHNMMTGRSRVAPPTSTAQEDTFMEVRQAFMGLAHHWEQGHKLFAMMDGRGSWGILVRMIEVQSLGGENNIPVFFILYRVVHASPNMDLQEYMGSVLGRPQGVVQVSTTDLERKCILKLFALNSKRLSSTYSPRRGKYEDQHRLTFVIPLGPLGMRDLGKLNNTPGCELCGKKMTSRCTQCLIVSYCGTECQKDDWNNHKKRCRSLKGGTWHTLTFSDPSIGNETGKMYRAVINRYDSPYDIKAKVIESPEDLSAPPPNIHNEKAFLVKFQISLSQHGSGSHMLLYDRQKSFHIQWFKSQDPVVFAEGEKAMGRQIRIQSGDKFVHIDIRMFLEVNR
ncbi:hypothetical protein H0H92_008058 [Tricholoma furcatifolium]|nr:hypothetical protein H0H92_008058 [Tricholoma furcatifolium]